MSAVEAPNFAVLLGPYIAHVSGDGVPRFLALLERGAAERYRDWARELPRLAAGLFACAEREDRIADTVEKAFAISPELERHITEPLPRARDAYYEAFAGHATLDQLRIQADAERQGAAAWRGIASQHEDEAVCEALERCARLEEENADWLDSVLDAEPGTSPARADPRSRASP